LLKLYTIIITSLKSFNKTSSKLTSFREARPIKSNIKSSANFIPILLSKLSLFKNPFILAFLKLSFILSKFNLLLFSLFKTSSNNPLIVLLFNKALIFEILS